MRLVDSDEIVRIVREEVKDEDNTLPIQFRAGVDYVLKIIDELSTVDAIPIEWFESKQTSGKLSFADCAAVEDLLNEWEKENEKKYK